MIFFICGEGGTGKSTLMNDVLSSIPRLQSIQQYTTRERRPNETSSEYIFLTESRFKKMVNDKKIIEYRVYRTSDGIDKYYGSGIKYLSKDYIVCGPPDMYLSLIGNIDSINIRLIKVTVSVKERLNRMINRYNRDESIYEACRRILADRDIFHDMSNLIYDLDLNNDRDYAETLNQLKDYILKELDE